MALRPLIAVDDQYIVWVTVAMQLVQYLLTVESYQGEVPQGNDSTGVVHLWQQLHDWTLGCVMYYNVKLEFMHAHALGLKQIVNLLFGYPDSNTF